MTHPAVNRLLQHAELQPDFALLQRSRDRLSATSEALIPYPPIERLFAQLDEVQRLAGNPKTGGNGRELRVLTVMALSHEILPQAIKRFRLQNPAVPITVQALHSPQIVSALALQEADVGFMFSPAAHPALAQTPLAQGRMVCVAPRDMLPAALCAGRTAMLADPIGRSLACRSSASPCRPIIRRWRWPTTVCESPFIDSCTAASADLARIEVLPLEPLIGMPVTVLLPLG